MITGIYKIINKINNKTYIGSSTDIKKRWRDHKWYLKENKHHNPHLQSAWNKYGKENFEFIVELECSVDELLSFENSFILKYNSMNRDYGYNVNDPRKIILGGECKENTKKILSERMLGDKNPMFGKFGKEHPKHGLKLSKNSRNLLSTYAKNRRGSKSNASKLNEKEVLEIREIYKNNNITQTALSKKYNVTQAMISDIIKRKSWTHI